MLEANLLSLNRGKRKKWHKKKLLPCCPVTHSPVCTDSFYITWPTYNIFLWYYGKWIFTVKLVHIPFMGRKQTVSVWFHIPSEMNTWMHSYTFTLTHKHMRILTQTHLSDDWPGLILFREEASRRIWGDDRMKVVINNWGEDGEKEAVDDWSGITMD